MPISRCGWPAPSVSFDTAATSGELSLATRAANLTLRSTSPVAQMEYFLRILYALLAEAHGGLMLHCAGILAPSGVHLFIGQSGSGKSTAASLSRGRGMVLNDDLIVLRPEQGRWIAYGTPFWNFETIDRDGQTASAAVAGIYTLVKDPNVFLEPLSAAAAVAALIGSCPVVNGDPGRALGFAGPLPADRSCGAGAAASLPQRSELLGCA